MSHFSEGETPQRTQRFSKYNTHLLSPKRRVTNRRARVLAGLGTLGRRVRLLNLTWCVRARQSAGETTHSSRRQIYGRAVGQQRLLVVAVAAWRDPYLNARPRGVRGAALVLARGVRGRRQFSHGSGGGRCHARDNGAHHRVIPGRTFPRPAPPHPPARHTTSVAAAPTTNNHDAAGARDDVTNGDDETYKHRDTTPRNALFFHANPRR